MILNSNDQRRLTALIASPLKEDGTKQENARPVIEMAVREFTRAYKKSLGILITPEQQDAIINDAIEKLGS